MKSTFNIFALLAILAAAQGCAESRAEEPKRTEFIRLDHHKVNPFTSAYVYEWRGKKFMMLAHVDGGTAVTQIIERDND